MGAAASKQNAPASATPAPEDKQANHLQVSPVPFALSSSQHHQADPWLLYSLSMLLHLTVRPFST